MKTLDELAQNEIIRREYKKTILLNIFKKICVRMKKDDRYREKIRKLFKQSHDMTLTVKALVEREFGFELNNEESSLMSLWFLANQKKKETRKGISIDVKKRLYDEQNGLCAACGECLGDDMSKVHVDHIIPWVLVGDELENNYQDLCETCNECKNSRIDYMLGKMLNIL